MILTQVQAKTVYDAMCALNNIGGTTLSARIEMKGTVCVVRENPVTHEVTVTNLLGGPTSDVESYGSQTDFSTAYGLQ